MNPRKLFLFAAALLLSPALYAQNVQVLEAWARASVPGQKTASAYLQLKSDSNAALVAAGSPLAGRVELHSTNVEGGVMRMRPIERVELPAGQTVALSPGGMHLMLLDLKQPLKPGDKLPLVLSVQSSGMSLTTLRVEAEVRAAGAAGGMHMHSH